MSLIIDKQCVYKTVHDSIEKEKTQQIPKKYLKLTCPLALISTDTSQERLPIITTDELSQNFDNFFPGKDNLISYKSKSSNKHNDKIIHEKKLHTIKKNKERIKSTSKTRKHKK